jgi:hypothetical protein
MFFEEGKRTVAGEMNFLVFLWEAKKILLHK